MDILYCHHLSGVECCSSCHDEWDAGYYSPIEYHKLENGLFVLTASVCCGGSNYIDNNPELLAELEGN